MALLFIALLDYLYQKYDFEKNIRMSKQDIKDEYKNSEGDPLIKSKIKQKQRQMAAQRMMQEVPNADVVITNPTHFAIALKYDENKAEAPFVVAKGVDFVAQKIKYIAKENDVIMVENRPLARSLYDQAQIGQAIPEEFLRQSLKYSPLFIKRKVSCKEVKCDPLVRREEHASKRFSCHIERHHDCCHVGHSITNMVVKYFTSFKYISCAVGSIDYDEYERAFGIFNISFLAPFTDIIQAGVECVDDTCHFDIW